MASNLLTKILSIGENNPLKKYQKLADQVMLLDDAFTDYTDAELAAETAEFRKRYAEGEALEYMLPEAFALVREAAGRTLNQHPYPVQILGGIALFKGNVAEMKTGEGKTLVATMPAYLKAISGEAVHIVTVNEYLAKYQSELMGRIYNLLGLTTGVIHSGQSDLDKRNAYACDIVYGTASEFGFDYLRDHMVDTLDQKVQRGLSFCIVDEIDSILMDEALTPLIISQQGDAQSLRELVRMTQAVRKLKENEDYTVNLKQHTVDIKDHAIDKIERDMGIKDLFAGDNSRLVGYMFSAVKAKGLFRRDKDYIVRNGGIEIVDKETGRVLEGRRFSEGLHQAIEAKENINVQPEDQTVASVSIQNFFRLYKTISGMTGTAKSEAGELMALYKLHTVQIPTNKPSARIDLPTQFYINDATKLQFILQDVRKRHELGQPVLIGTSTVAKSETVSKMLKSAGIPHLVLNAKDDTKEAYIIANAGRKGSVTVATNMAGRGTDIILGGNPETLAVEKLKKEGLIASKHPETYTKRWNEIYPILVEECSQSGEEVAVLGGLHVIGTEMHESKRIDNQLRGRAGRQGEPGSSQFYCSLEDEIIKKFKPANAASLAAQANENGELPFDNSQKIFKNAQHEATTLNRSIRTDVQKYDEVIDQARRHVYGQRDEVLAAADSVFEAALAMANRVVERYVSAKLNPAPHAWDLESFWGDMRSLYPATITSADVEEEMNHVRDVNLEWLITEIQSDANIVLKRHLDAIGDADFVEYFQFAMITAIDESWTDYLGIMESILDSINFRAMAQVEPINEYRREANYHMQQITEHIEETVIRSLMYIEDSSSPKTYERTKIIPAAQRKKSKPTRKQKRNNSHVTSRVAFESGLTGYDDEINNTASAPMNRAERRAAAKRKGRREQ